MIRTFAAALILSTLPGCMGQGPFPQIQFCLRDRSNTADFIATMKAISAKYDMHYVDRSAQVDSELRSLDKYPGYKGLTISAHRNDGLGWAASKFGPSGHDVAIGFSEGSNRDEARRFADSVREVLRKTWDVHEVPADKGAVPGCGVTGSSAASRRE